MREYFRRGEVVRFERRGSSRPSESSSADPTLRRRRVCRPAASLACAAPPSCPQEILQRETENTGRRRGRRKETGPGWRVSAREGRETRRLKGRTRQRRSRSTRRTPFLARSCRRPSPPPSPAGGPHADPRNALPLRTAPRSLAIPPRGDADLEELVGPLDVVSRTLLRLARAWHNGTVAGDRPSGDGSAHRAAKSRVRFPLTGRGPVAPPSLSPRAFPVHVGHVSLSSSSPPRSLVPRNRAARCDARFRSEITVGRNNAAVVNRFLSSLKMTRQDSRCFSENNGIGYRVPDTKLG